MKKTLIILAAVLLIAGLFIACSADINSADKTASVSFGNAAKGLTPSAPSIDVPDVNSLIWWYQADNSASSTVPGETTGWTRVNSDGVGFATLPGFKTGAGWTFTIAGKTPAAPPEDDTPPSTVDYSDCVYYGTNEDVTLRRGINTINIDLEWVNPDSSTVVFSEIAIQYTDTEQWMIGDSWKIYEGETLLKSGIISSAEYKINSSIEDVEEGSHTYTLFICGSEGTLNGAGTSVTITGYPGATITVTGNSGDLSVLSDVVFYPEIGQYLPSDAVAVVSNGVSMVPYTSLSAAIAASEAGNTVVLLKDITDTASSATSTDNTYARIDKSITLDGNGHTIRSSANRTVAIEGSYLTVSVTDLTIITTNTGAWSQGLRIVANNSTITVDRCNIQAPKYYPVNVSRPSNDTHLIINDSIITGYCALNIWGDRHEIEVNYSTLTGNNTYPDNGRWYNNEDFGVIVIEGPGDDAGDGITATFTGCTITASSVANQEDIVLFNPSSINNRVDLVSCTLINCSTNTAGLYRNHWICDFGTGNTLMVTDDCTIGGSPVSSDSIISAEDESVTAYPMNQGTYQIYTPNQGI